MMFECSIFIEDNATPGHSFKRFVFCNLHLGMRIINPKSTKKEPYLCAVTPSNIYKYRILNNIKRIISKELVRGKISIEFCHPSHSLMVRSNNGKLPIFLRLFEKISDLMKLGQLEKIPVIPSNLKFIAKSNVSTAESSVKEIISKIACITLRKELLNNIHVLHLKNNNLKNIPVQLGLLRLSDINLENNDLGNDDLLWLEERPIRRSLGALNLSSNKVTSFPSALIDYYRLVSLNLKDNQIQNLPGKIGSLQCLRNLDLSNNEIRYLPASITQLKLVNLDLTHNYLTCNIPVKSVSLERENFKAVACLEDLTATKIDSMHRRQLTIEDCPRRLLEKLRCLSQCICDKQSLPSAVTEFYIPLTSVKFSTSYCIQPQKIVKSSSGKNIFLQYHFCTYPSTCESRKYHMIPITYFRSSTSSFD